MAETKEITTFSEKAEESHELVPSLMRQKELTEIQSVIVVAKKFPRNEDEAYQKIIRACKRPSFAENASYSFPRGTIEVKGPSVNLAREMARIWGNVRFGIYILRDDEGSRLIEGWGWDIQTNTKIEMQDDFAKVIYRKAKGWIKPDERDLRELTNRKGAILVRNCLLQLLPKDFVDDAMIECAKTVKAKITEDPDAAKKKIIESFLLINVSVEMLEEKLGHPVGKCSPAEIQELREIYLSIRDGNSVWGDYLEKETMSNGKLKSENLKPSKEKNRGHEDTGFEKTKKAAKKADDKQMTEKEFVDNVETLKENIIEKSTEGDYNSILYKVLGENGYELLSEVEPKHFGEIIKGLSDHFNDMK